MKRLKQFAAVMLLVLIIFAILLLGCETNVKSESTSYKIKGNPMEVVTIEGCEYFKWYAYYSANMTHKGNCKNPIHKCK